MNKHSSQFEKPTENGRFDYQTITHCIVIGSKEPRINVRICSTYEPNLFSKYKTTCLYERAVFSSILL